MKTFVKSLLALAVLSALLSYANVRAQEPQFAYVQMPPLAVPIFMYHTSSETEPEGIVELYVKPSVFEEQIIHLVENGYTFVTFDDWDNLHNIDKPVFITFDDGYESNYTEIFPILERHGARITLFMLIRNIGPGGLTEDMMRRMSDSGLVKFESHTLTHPSFPSISHDDDRLRRELLESKEIIEEITGVPVVAIAYPYGNFDERTIEAAREFYRFGISTLPGWHVTQEDNNFKIRRLRVNRSTSIRGFINMLR